MDNTQQREIASIILAAGKGKRMNLEEGNKVTLNLGDKPIIKHIVDFMHSVDIKTVIVVVGHAKESVMQILNGENVLFAEQIEQLGTADAAASALKELPPHITDVCVVYGDDAVLYTHENRDIITELFSQHISSNASFTFLTIEQDNPVGLGRIVRDQDDNVTAIIEEKDATDEQKQIKEINPGCFVFRVDFLKEYLPKVEKSPATGEYYLTSLIDMAFRKGLPVVAVKGGNRKWRGVNTPEELEEAHRIIGNKYE